ncbi:MAG: hypothetical protein QF886_08005, partial [Planctomycetota bacterium]|nr:hypothetical protein [Planctomycetota bacterium]
MRAISTFTDWTAMSGCWGRTGVCRIFEQLRIAGIRDVYWRVFNGGLAMYPSRVAEAQGRQVYDFVVAHDEYPFSNRPVHYVREVDFNRYDSLPDAFEVAEEFGINLHLWYSIYEDEHGRAYQSKLNADLPHCRHTDREGRQYSGTFDWYYPEIRDYKLAIIDELLAYPAKGIMLDLVRHNATASADANGIHRFGYNPEIRAAFKEAHGADPLELTADDPEWLAFKTEIRTSLIREIRHRMDRRGNALELSLMLWPLDYLPWACIDVPALTGEGAVQMLAGFSLTYSMSPDEARLHMDVLKRQCGGEDVLIMPGLSSYGGLTSDHVDVFAQAAEEAGAPGVMLYEADSLVKFDITPAVRVINAGRPRYKRSLQAGRVAAADAPWDTVPVFDDFLYHFGQNPDEVPSERTSVRLAFNDEALMIRFECDDRDMAAALAP